MGRSAEELGIDEVGTMLARHTTGSEPAARRGTCARCKNPAILNVDTDRWEHHFVPGEKTPPIEEVVALDKHHTAVPETSITVLMGRALDRNPPTAAEVLAELARSLRGSADHAWAKTDAWASKGQNEEAEHHRGRAHAFCEALGDQVALGWFGVWDA